MSYPSPNWMVIAIVGGDPLVGHALELSLQSTGYDVRFLDRLSINGTLDLFERLGLVLLAPRISDVDREAVLRCLGHSRPQHPETDPFTSGAFDEQMT